MKLDKTRRALAVSPLIALLGALAIMLVLSGDASAAWTSSVVVGNPANASAMEIDPTNGHVHVAWFDGGSPDAYWYAECDPVGNSCKSPVGLASTPAVGGGIVPQFATSEALRPGVAVDSLGNVYVGFSSSASGNGPAVYQKKPAGSNSFNAPVTLGSGWQVRLATDSSNNLHAVWGASGQLNYRRFDPTGRQLVDQPNFSNGDGQGASIVTDTNGNAHIVYEGNLVGPKVIKYVKITVAGALGSTGTVFGDPSGYNSINPNLAVDAAGKIHFVWRDSNPNNIQILYKRCDAGTLGNCTAIKTINTDGQMGDDPSITTIGTNFFVTYYQQLVDPTNDRFAMVYFGNTGVLQQLDGQTKEWWPVIRGNQTNGELHLIYRLAPGNGNFYLLYRHENCNCLVGPPTPTLTATPTNGSPPPPPKTPTATPTLGPPPRQGSPVNLTNNGGTAYDHAPGVVRDGNGDIVVAWQRDVGHSSKHVYARVARGGGAFSPLVVVGSNTSPSAEPNLFDAGGSSVYALFMSEPGGISQYDIVDSVLGGGNWSAMSNLTNGAGIGNQDGVGVQATDGKVWVAWRESESTLVNDTFAMQLGGGTYQLSSSGSASPHPAIAAGANGQVYVAWVDKGPSGTGCCIMVSQWNGSRWVSLPNATNSIGPFLPSVAFSNGQLYAVWENGMQIQQTIWNGSSWGTITTVSSAGSAPKNPRVFVPASGNVFVVWSDRGVIYLSKNSGPRRAVSTGVPRAKEPSLFVDNNDVPYIAFQNGNLWYVANP